MQASGHSGAGIARSKEKNVDVLIDRRFEKHGMTREGANNLKPRPFQNWTRTVFRRFYSVTEVSAWAGYIALTGIILIVLLDIGGRSILNKALPGAFELVDLTAAIVSGFSIMYCTVKRGHVAIDFIIVARFSKRSQIIMRRIFSLVGFGTWLVVAYGVYLYALDALRLSLTTDFLHINPAPFLLMWIAAAFLSSLTLLIQTFQSDVSDETTGEEGGRSQ